MLAAALTGLTVATLIGQETRLPWPAWLLAVLSAAPLAARQRFPVASMAVIVGVLLAYALIGYDEFPNSAIGMVIGMFTVAMLRSQAVSAALFVSALAVAAVAYVNTTVPVSLPQVAQVGVILACAWGLGATTKAWAAQAERAAAQAAQAVAEERVRIARELHDIVAHHMSVISLQAGLAEYVLDVDPPTAKKAIATVGDATREALLDMRRLLDVLRVDHDEADTDYRPQPGLAGLDDLVSRTRAAGLDIEIAVTGQVRPLPAGPDLCAYRVIQESLTNVLKHAGPARARVELDYGERTLTVRISDDGAKPTRGQPVPSTSHGLRGMRERAELYGGVLTAEPGPDRGFIVLLRLPMEELP